MMIATETKNGDSPKQVQQQTETAQTLTLGRRNDDKEDFYFHEENRGALLTTTTTTATAPTTASMIGEEQPSTKTWMPSLFSRNKQQSPQEGSSSSNNPDIDHPATDGNSRPASLLAFARRKKKKHWNHRYSSARTSTGDPLLLAEGGETLPPPNDEVTREEAVAHDCEFFYQELSSPPPTTRSDSSMRFRALRADDSLQSSHFLYRNAVDVMAPPVLARYRAKFDQYNQVLDPTEEQGLLSLQLDIDECDDESSSSQLKPPLHQQSNLLYQHPTSGRMVLRLPMDNVRLLMDPDLKTGVLSVEQRRRNMPHNPSPPVSTGVSSRSEHHSSSDDDDPLKAPAAAAALDDIEQHRSKQHDDDELPPLHYVLTVPPDLYCKLVSEMSDAVNRPYHCGMRQCCNEKEQVDIRVAVCLMIVIMIVLLVNTIIWPT